MEISNSARALENGKQYRRALEIHKKSQVAVSYTKVQVGSSMAGLTAKTHKVGCGTISTNAQ